MLAALVAALLLAAALPLASAVDVTGRCVAGPTTGSCANLAAQVWENSTYTSANASATVDLFVRNQAFLPSACIAAGLPFLCAEAYKPCLLVNYTDAGGNNFTIGVPARPCRKLCVDTNTSCYSILASFNLLYLVQCDAADADGPQYPTSVTTYDVSAIDASTVDIECNNGTSNLISAGNVTCAEELFVQLPPNATAFTPYNVTEVLWESVPQYTGKCAIRCPNPQYGDDFWRSISIVWFVTCLLALLCSIATLVTFVLYPDRRKFPSILILHMTVACMIGAFSGTMSLWDRGDVKRMMCQHEWSFADWRRPSLCTVQALLFIFGQHGVLWWWLAIAFNMVALIVFRINLKQYYWAIVAFGWVPPFIFLFISIGLKDASPGISWPFCTPDSDGILYYPIGVLGSLGFLCSVLVVGWIIYITLRGNTDAKFWTLAQRVTRPVLFGLICAIPYAVVYAYRYSNKPAEQLTQVREYLLCIIQGQGQVDCGTVPRTSPAFNYALSISLSCIGILTFACYSTHVKYYTDLKAWTKSRVTGLTTGLGSSSAASKRSSRREDDAWQRASSDTEMQNVGAASRF